jgi:hypothetical protein
MKEKVVQRFNALSPVCLIVICQDEQQRMMMVQGVIIEIRIIIKDYKREEVFDFDFDCDKKHFQTIQKIP